MTDSKPSLLQRLRDFLDTLGDEDATPDVPDGVSGTPTEEVTAEEIDNAEAETEAEVEGESATEPGDGEPAETTPGTSEVGGAETDDLRAQLTAQAATIETLRNALAEAGGIDPTEDAELDTEAELDDRTEDDVVADFDTDYDRRQALLADINKEN